MKRKYFTEEERKEAKKRKKKKHYERHKERIKLKSKNYYQNHKEEKLMYQKEYFKSNKEKIEKYYKEYRKNHKEEKKLRDKKYRETHKKERNERHQNRMKNDINYKLTCNLRIRLNVALKNNWKIGSAVKDLGCSISELKIYLENKFQEGMSWENWAWNGWHIDHIIPLSSFNLQNRGEFLKACHYTNLQPMWAEENISKSNKTHQPVV